MSTETWEKMAIMSRWPKKTWAWWDDMGLMSTEPQNKRSIKCPCLSAHWCHSPIMMIPKCVTLAFIQAPNSHPTAHCTYPPGSDLQTLQTHVKIESAFLSEAVLPISVSGTTKPGTWELSLILLFLLYSIHSVINVNYKHCLILLLSPWLLNTKFRPSIHLHHQQLYWSFAPSLSSSNPPSTQHWGSLIKTKINNQLLIVLTM